MTPDEIEALIAEADRLCELERYDEAYKLDLKAADAGDARAQLHLGWYCENGLGTARDIAAAIKWYSGAAEQGMDDAVRALYSLKKDGVDLHDSPVIRKIEREVESAQILFANGNYTEAIATAQSAADTGNPRAKYIIAQSLEKLGDKSDRRLRLLEEAADDGFTAAMISLGKSLLENNPERSVDYFKKAADNNSAQAFYELGHCYELGIGVSPNPHDAFSNYTRAYERGYKLASARLASFYRDGTIATPDDKKYRQLLEEGCEYGDSDSLYEYALTFYRDPATTPGKESAELFRKAAATGNLNAKALLAKHVLFGWTSAGDKSRSKKDLTEAAASGNALACYILGECYARGIRGVFDIDYRKSGDYFMKSVGDENTADAYYRGGMSYLNTDRALAEKAFIKGIGQGLRSCAEAYIRDIISDSWMLTDKRHKTAEEFKAIAQCAAFGIERAYFEVGICHCNGWGAPIDQKKAFENFSIGAEKGDVNSIFMLSWCYYSGIGIKYDEARAISLLKNQISRRPDPLLLCALARFSRPDTIEDHKKVIELYRQALDLLPSADKATTAYVVITWSENQYRLSKNINRLYPSYTPEGRKEISEMLKKVIDSGCTKAMVALAQYYDNCSEYKSEVLPLLRKAAEAGDREGMYMLCSRSDDPREKRHWLEESAKRGFPDAIVALGLDYLRGRDFLEKDIPKGIFWLNKGVESGNVRAMYHLGDYYMKSSSPEDVSKGLDLWKRAAPYYSSARDNLAKYYYRNHAEDTEEAIRWLELAMNHYLKSGYNFALGIHYRSCIAKLKRKPSPLNIFIELYENVRDECVILWKDLTDK